MEGGQPLSCGVCTFALVNTASLSKQRASSLLTNGMIIKSVRKVSYPTRGFNLKKRKWVSNLSNTRTGRTTTTLVVLLSYSRLDDNEKLLRIVAAYFS